MNFGHRLKAARKAAGLTQEALGALSNVSQKTISKIERGAQERSTEVVKLAAACEVRPEWLANGSGPMRGSPEKAIMSEARQTGAEYDALSADAIEIAHAWLRLSPERQAHFRQTLFLEAAVASFYPRLNELSRGTSWADCEKDMEHRLAKYLAKRAA